MASTKLIIVCPRCGNEYRKPVAPVGFLNDARDEIERLRGLLARAYGCLQTLGAWDTAIMEALDKEFPRERGTMPSDKSDIPAPRRSGVERDGPPDAVTVRICEWCGSEPLADTDWCSECDMHREWLNVRYVLPSSRERP